VRLEFGLDLAGSFPDRAVDAAGVAVLAPAAAAGRAAAGDLHFGRVGERGDFVADVVGGQPGRGLGLLHRVLPVGLWRFATRERGSGCSAPVTCTSLVPVGSEPRKWISWSLSAASFVHVVRRDDRRLLVVDQSPELAVETTSRDLLPS